MAFMAFCKRHGQKIAVACILILAGFLTYFNVQAGGYGNLYYTAAIKSMMLSPHNFFFASFDPGGFVSVDKPPVALWIQTLFAFAFGLHGWSLLTPEALAAVFSVLLVYHLVHRTFGFIAGIIAALVLALSPIFIAVSRTNNPDSILVLDLLLAAWALLKAAESENVKMLLLAMVLVGVGFNIKMLEAYLVLPAFFLAYYFCKTTGLRRKIIHLAAAVIVLLAVSFSWAFAVDLTPAASRPYVGSSKTNSVVELALGYNGINRIWSGLKWPESFLSMLDSHTRPMNSLNIQTAFDIPPKTVTPAAGMPGPFRLFDRGLGGQVGWFLPIALLGFPAFIMESYKNGSRVAKNKRVAVAFWLSWVMILFVFFSSINITHRYYLSVMTPGIAAMTGIGLSSMWSLYKREGGEGYYLPAALALNSAVQALIISRYTNAGWAHWLAPLVANACICIAFALILIRRYFIRRKGMQRLTGILAAVCIAFLFAAPAVWSSSPIIYGISQANPVALPERSLNVPVSSIIQSGGTSRSTSNSLANYESNVIRYMMGNRKGSKYVGAVQDVGTAEDLILSTGKPVVTIGGFSGNDPILTLEEFKRMVQAGKVRYFLFNLSVHRLPSAITGWVMQNGKVIPPAEIAGGNVPYSGPSKYVLYALNADQTKKPTGIYFLSSQNCL